MADPSRVKPVTVKQGFDGEPARLLRSGKHELRGDGGVLMGTGPLIPRPVLGKRALPPHEE